MATVYSGPLADLVDYAAEPEATHGVAIPGVGFKLVVQIAAINATNVDGAPLPEWDDITSYVSQIGWLVGDAANDTGNPTGTLQIIARDFTAAAPNDPFNLDSSLDTRFGTQCLIRFGFYDTTEEVWLPQFTGVIDSIQETWRPWQGARLWELTCFDLWYFITGNRGGGGFSDAASTAEVAWTAALGVIGYPFKVRWANSNYSWRVKIPLGDSVLGVISTLANSTDAEPIMDPSGVLHILDRDHVIGGGRSWYVVDAYELKAGHPALPLRNATFQPTQWTWRNSVDRFLQATSAQSINYPSGAGVSGAGSLSARYLYRRDAAGYPLTGLYNDNSGSFPTELTTLAVNAQARHQQVTYLDRVEFDTATAGQAQLNGTTRQPNLRDMLVFLTECTIRRAYYVQRRAAPASAGYASPLTRIDEIGGLITVEGPARFRWRATHGLKAVLE